MHTIITSLTIGFITSYLAVFLEYCFDEGMIFNKYYKLIDKLPEWINKPLGGCIICYGTWITIVFNLVFFRLDLDIMTQIISLLTSIASFTYFTHKYMESYD